MRIISGIHKGRRFFPPKNLPVRPTTDFAKEGLFNILRNQKDIEETSVLDLCAGTGNMTFEFASRGAKSVIAVDQHFGCVRYIKQLSAELQLKQIRAVKSELFKFIKAVTGSYDFIFADPPYGMENVTSLPDLILKKKILSVDGLLIVEHGKDVQFTDHPNFYSTRRFGNVNFTFFEVK